MLLALTIVTSFSLLAWVFVLMAAADNWSKEPKIDAYTYPGPPVPAPPLSVIIPARNERASISECLDAVLAQDYPSFEVIVVDDRSEDGTPEVVEEYCRRDGRVRLIRGEPVPPGWAGKCHAIDQGVRAASGDYLLMLDTDTFLKPRCLSMAMRDAVEKNVDLYTLIFEAQCTRFWEKVVQPLMFQVILLGVPLRAINDPARKEAAAPGPFLLFRRSSYEAIGGHAGMRDEVVEDFRLAQKIKESGLRLYVVNAVSLVYSRRPIGLREIWRGWSRVLYTGLDKNPAVAAGALLAMAIFMLLPWLVPPAALWWMATQGFSTARAALCGLGVAHCAVFVALRKLLHVFYRLDFSKAWLQPLATSIAMAMLANSFLVEAFSKPVVWKGRSYRND
jgi:chlorobactene glucosyltransferase